MQKISNFHSIVVILCICIGPTPPPSYTCSRMNHRVCTVREANYGVAEDRPREASPQIRKTPGTSYVCMGWVVGMRVRLRASSSVGTTVRSVMLYFNFSLSLISCLRHSVQDQPLLTVTRALLHCAAFGRLAQYEYSASLSKII